MDEVEEYQNIRESVSNLPCTTNQLNAIKDYFRKAIDSPRRFDATITFSGLIRILEKRDVLNKHDISGLKYIASCMQRDDIFRRLTIGRQVPLQGTPLTGNEISERVLPHISQDPIKRIDDIICTDIGQKWNDFARKLDIPEGFIDELENRYHGKISMMVREILIYYREKCDPRYWKHNICKALEDARRRDLSYEIRKVFSMNGLM